MPRALPGPSARLGSELPTSGIVTVAGLQPISRSGILIRTHRPYDQPMQDSASRYDIELVPAGCVEPAQFLKIDDAGLNVRCGLIQGASGGGVFAESDDGLVLLGVISSVTSDLSANYVAPMAAVHELLEHQSVYLHSLASDRTRTSLSRSPDVFAHS